MSDFQVGDVVVCIEDRTRPGFPTSPFERGQFYRVNRIGVGPISREPSVVVDGVPAWAGAYRFRKLPKSDEQFTAQMRACKPQRVGEPA